MPLEPEIAAKLLDADLVNIAKRIQDGKPVTKVQRDLLEDSAKDEPEEQGDSSYSINKLSSILGTDRRTITKHLKGKEPDKMRGKLKLYSLNRVSEILQEASGKGSEKSMLECKKLQAKIQNIEIRNDELMNKLIPADQVTRIWLSHIQKAKAALSGLEDLAPVIAGLKVNQIKSKLHEAVINIMEDLSSQPIENESTNSDIK